MKNRIGSGCLLLVLLTLSITHETTLAGDCADIDGDSFSGCSFPVPDASNMDCNGSLPFEVCGDFLDNNANGVAEEGCRGADSVIGYPPHHFRAWRDKAHEVRIDGVASRSEWDWASCHKTHLVGYDDETQYLEVCAGDDSSKLYLLVVIGKQDFSDRAEPCYDFINLYFDNTNNGLLEPGENRWGVRFDGLYRDNYNPNGVPHWSYQDPDGQENFRAAILHSKPGPNAMGTYTVEYAGELDSADDLHDFSLVAGDTVGFAVGMSDGDPRGTATARAR